MTMVLITGAGRGLGLALARQYVSRGISVLGCSEPAKARPLQNLAADSGGLLCSMPLDFADERSIPSVKRMIGDQPIDILVNNAEARGPEVQSDREIDPVGWMTTLRINALAPILMAQAFRENLRRSAAKKLIAISSAYGSTGKGWPANGLARDRYAYCASKAALNNGMRALARDWASDGILVGIIHADWLRDGGPHMDAGPPGPDKLACAIMRLIEELTPATSGTFRSYRGDVVAW